MKGFNSRFEDFEIESFEFESIFNFCIACFCSLCDHMIMLVHYDVMTVMKTAIECICCVFIKQEDLAILPWNTRNTHFVISTVCHNWGRGPGALPPPQATP